MCVKAAIRRRIGEGHRLMMVAMTAAIRSPCIHAQHTFKLRAYIQSSSHTPATHGQREIVVVFVLTIIHSFTDNYACAMHTTVITDLMLLFVNLKHTKSRIVIMIFYY